MSDLKEAVSLSSQSEKKVSEEVDVQKALYNHMRGIMRHIDEVRKNCIILGEKIVEQGGTENERFGRQLIANGYIHDNSKLHGVEWRYLVRGGEYLSLAHEQHVSTNPHHPEYWVGGIKEMPDIYIAEMVCDWKARSSEMGTDLRAWVKDHAAEKFGFTVNTNVYKTIKKYIDLLLDDVFNPVS